MRQIEECDKRADYQAKYDATVARIGEINTETRRNAVFFWYNETIK